MQTQNQTYFNELFAIFTNKSLAISIRYQQCKTILERAAKELTCNEALQFSNLFSRLSFIVGKHQLNRDIHIFRKAANQIMHEKRIANEEEFQTHFKFLAVFIAQAFKMEIPEEIKNVFPETEFREVRKNSERSDYLRVHIIDRQGDFLICDTEENFENGHIKVRINDPNHNEVITSVNNFWKGSQVNLVNIEIDEEGIYHPKFLILEPDYLLNITSIAECFQDYGTSEWQYFKSKWEEIPNSQAILLGNFANLVVDELFRANDIQQISFEETFLKSFKSAPFEYAVCDNLKQTDQFIEYWKKAHAHFERIKKVITLDFPRYGISVEKACLEPSFLCNRYGIQGRLDILELEKNKHAKIVELKSGSVPYPDDGQSIKPNHEVQLYLYYLLIAGINQLKFSEISEKTEGYILYSKVNQNNLRYKKPYLKRMQEIFDMRNRIIIREFQLAQDNLSLTQEIIESITPENLLTAPRLSANFKNLLTTQIHQLTQAFQQLNELEKTYFYSFVSFISKENYLSKIGDSQYDSKNGLANLWLQSFAEKVDNYEILYDLEITRNEADTEQKEITFQRPIQPDCFANFREGDSCLLYPQNNKNETVTSNQIFKCTLLELRKESVIVKIGYKQRNTHFFEQHKKWALEHDSMDLSYNAMYRNLYTFICASQKKKNLLLTQKEPEEIVSKSEQNIENKEIKEHERIISKALNAKDYFILNGPPGTGKTSIIIKNLVAKLQESPNRSILLLAYTNRAVDELCDTVDRAISGKNRKFIRIGNELACSPKHRPSLLKNVLDEEEIKLAEDGKKFSRESVRQLLQNQSIYISTIASINGKEEIFKLKKFDTIIVDEASQVLEPQIIGILSKCKRFILIGDHKQLPAIVLQNSEKSKTNNSLLESIGLNNRKNSLFERLYVFCEKNNLHHAFDSLTYQGRMHRDIADFPNRYFYHSRLKELEGNLAQTQALQLHFPENNPLAQKLASQRVLFFPTQKNKERNIGKSNEEEADLVVQLISEIQNLYTLNHKTWDEHKTLGVITPFRNQIALIKQKLEEARIPHHETITIDTVERYQGSQRDIIIYSFAVNSPFQLKSIVNFNDNETVDRKLNVALTRAREQLILIGNIDFLSENTLYQSLVNHTKGTS